MSDEMDQQVNSYIQGLISDLRQSARDIGIMYMSYLLAAQYMHMTVEELTEHIGPGDFVIYKRIGVPPHDTYEMSAGHI